LASDWDPFKKAPQPVFISELSDLIRLMEPRRTLATQMSKRAQRMRAVAIAMYQRAKVMQESKTTW